MGWRNYQKAVDEPCGTVIPNPFDVMKNEYHDMLTRYWGPEKKNFTDEELQEMIDRLGELFQELTQQGCGVPILTPEGRKYLQGGKTSEDITA